MSAPHASGPGPSAPSAPPRSLGGRPPLRRRRDGRLIAGVAAGVADHLRLDVAIVRILLVVLTVVTNGLGILAYVLGWLFIPTETQEEAAARRRRATDQPEGRDPLFWIGVGLLVIGALWLLHGPLSVGRLSLLSPRLLIPLVLVGFGLALWRAGDRSEPSTVQPPAQTPSAWRPADAGDDTSRTDTDPSRPHHTSERGHPTEPGPTTEAPVHTDETSDTRPLPHESAAGTTATLSPPDAAGPPPPTPPTAQPADWTPPPRPERTTSPLARITLGVALLTVGVLWLLDLAEVLSLRPGNLFAAGLLVVGLGLLVGAFAGRARSLIIVGILLVPPVAAAEIMQPLPIDFQDLRGAPLGEVHERPGSVDELRSSYQVGAGELRIDLTDVSFDAEHGFDAQVGAGELRIIVPADVAVDASGRVGMGDLRILDRRSEGVGLSRTVADPGEGPGQLTIRANVGLGELRIERAPADLTADRDQ